MNASGYTCASAFVRALPPSPPPSAPLSPTAVAVVVADRAGPAGLPLRPAHRAQLDHAPHWTPTP
ncbi:hypothetical protein [Streptomyces sp. CB01881]|uniref:hypothetical protein n=1 Tax=Streptomyces sp. CB01881 TaxID=2078691 RepID=UPI0013A5AEB3|nr:hypothetical protein [Streptomyces sp. CB01881]